MKYLLLLVGWLNHVSAILIMSQGVGLSREEKSALELRTYELTQAIENAEQSVHLTGLTPRQKEEIRQMIQSALDTGSA